ncbi:MAG: hypothetical protein HY585_04460 [Candidatus Omnitrophica bacterium]|nr:hypothetical protein [Candidatus Omnitrophota bacterium]
MNQFLNFLICSALILSSGWLYASEVFEETPTTVIVREHPKTGKPYASIVSSGQLSQDPFAGQRQKMRRPDYRMLDPKIKSGEIPYEGPYSSSKKVYIFAASLATLGVAGGAVGMAVAPAAAAGSAASGGGAYLAGAGAIAGTATAVTVIKAQPDPNQDDFTQISKSESIEFEKGDTQ